MISKHKNWPKFSLVVATHISVSQTFDRCPIVLRVDWRGVISQKGSPVVAQGFADRLGQTLKI